VNQLLKRANELESSGRVDESLDIIYDALDNMCWTCDSMDDWKALDDFLSSVNTDDHSTCILLGLLTASLRANYYKLSERRCFFDRCKKTIEERGQNEQGLLTGLEG
jgi:hypothetical protein